MRVVISMDSIITVLRLKQKLKSHYYANCKARYSVSNAYKSTGFNALHLSSPSKQTARPRIIQYEQKKSLKTKTLTD